MEELFKKLDKLIKEYDNFIIMAHSNPDLDALGSALGLYKVIESKGKKVSIFLTQNADLDEGITRSIDKLSHIYFVDKESYKVNDQTLLFIVDVHSSKRLDYSEIINDNLNIVVLDHHIKRNDYIHNNLYMYINSSLSSMVELITYYIVHSNIEIDSVVASIMLAGIEIDTNGYNLKTTSKTYLAASHLMNFGADIIFKQQLLKESKDEYVKRADYIKQSYIVKSGIAMCILTDKVEQQTLAEIADDLLKLDSVEASFVIGRIGKGKVGVSTRSMGNINVEKVVNKLGGGGSKTNAAAQIDMPLQEVKRKIVKLLG